MIPITICILSFISTILASEYPLLKVKLQTDETQDFKELSAIIQQKAYGKFISLQQAQCGANKNCRNFKVFDPFGALLQQYQGVSSVVRYLGIIQKYIDTNNYPISQASKSLELQNEELSLKIYEQRRKLLEETIPDDWEKAEYKHNKDQKHAKKGHKQKAKVDQHKEKHLTHQSHQKETPERVKIQNKQKKEDPVPTVKSQKIASRFQVTEHVFAWRMAYIIMIIGLVFGMRYLKQQQDRVGAQQKNHLSEQTESLNIE